MKLLTGYNRILVLVSTLGLVCIGFLFYHTLTYYLNQQLDNSLNEELLEVKDFTHIRNIAPAPELYEDLVIEYKRTDQPDTAKQFADTVFFNPKKQIQEPARYLKTDVSFGASHYEVLILTSKLEPRAQIMSIFLVIISPVLLLLVFLWLFNRYLNRKLWHPFRQILENIKAFNLNQEEPFKPVQSPVQEFQELSQAILDISLRIRSDFKDVKLFTENASHEMMTPLAVINSKLDTMLQSDRLGKEESDTLADLYKATSRLTKLNQSLLLMVKIDHDLIREQEEIDLSVLVADKVSYFQELIQNRNLSLITLLQKVQITTNKQLMEILISNLLSNAIRHNQEKGNIQIELSETMLTVKNTGSLYPLDEQKIYERFYKDSNSDGTGLGLAILKQVCNRLKFEFRYAFEDHLHCFEIYFGPDGQH